MEILQCLLIKGLQRMIKLNTKRDQRIAEVFPDDPDCNICIITESQTLRLQHAFLTMDSSYFSQIDPDTRQVDLRDQKQQPLIRVIHSLYGQQLILNSVSELMEIYPIIIFLGIEDYKANLLVDVQGRKEILENIEFLEFSFRYKICFQEVLQIHLENKLKLLEESKNYLQLNKIQNDTFDFLLLAFIDRWGEGQKRVINNVMQNYFNRNNIRPLTYLRNPLLSKLLPIWLHFHHVAASEMVSLRSMPNIMTQQENRSRRRTQQVGKESKDSILQKKRRVAELQKQLSYKDQVLNELSSQLQQIKKDLGLKAPQQITARSLLIDLSRQDTPYGMAGSGMRKTKRLAELSPQVQSDNETSVNDKNGPNQLEKRKSVDTKQIKGLMHRLGSKNLKRV